MATRGRPPFTPTPTQRKSVAIAAGGGMSHEQIAMALGISIPTLDKYFEVELSTGAYQRRMEVLVALHTAAKKGNVSAAKAYACATPQFFPPSGPMGEAAPASEAREATQAPKGKKERQHEEAVVAQVGTDWEQLLPQTPGGLVQ